MQFHPESPILRDADLSRLRFVTDLKRHLFAKAGPENRRVYEARLAHPDDKTPRSPKEAAARREEIRRGMEAEPYFQAWSAVLRASQDLMWDYVGRVVDGDLDRLTDRFAAVKSHSSGSVTTDPSLAVPDYLASSDTHRMPGSYHADRRADDVRAGAVYDLGGAIYQLGIGNASGALLNDSRGRTVVAFLNRNYPTLAPLRILDMGCSAGHNTAPVCAAFPKAQVHAIDIGAAMVRYAFLRAEGLGVPAHFSQQDAEHTSFDDASFDLVMSQIVLHETTPEAMQRIIAESFRILRPGGVAVHLEVPIRYEHLDAFDQFFRSWEQYYNDEHNIEGVGVADFRQLAERAGFIDVRTGFQPIPASNAPTPALSATPLQGSWYIVSGTKPA